MRMIIWIMVSLILSGCLSQKPEMKPLAVSPAGVNVEGRAVGGLNNDQLQSALAELAKQSNIWPQNAGFDSKGEIIQERPGRMLDVAATAAKVMAAPANSSIEAVYTEVRPSISRDMLSSANNIGSYETEIIDDSPDRVNNIWLTTNLLNNTIIEPGQEFSFNKIVGEPNYERGFRDAVILINGEKSQGMGGGICQVSSTLYNAVLNAGLIIVERHAHSQPVNYVPEGKDATTFTDKDFRFVNTTRQILILRTLQQGKIVKADIWALPNAS